MFFDKLLELVEIGANDLLRRVGLSQRRELLRGAEGDFGVTAQELAKPFVAWPVLPEFVRAVPGNSGHIFAHCTFGKAEAAVAHFEGKADHLVLLVGEKALYMPYKDAQS